MKNFTDREVLENGGRGIEHGDWDIPKLGNLQTCQGAQLDETQSVPIGRRSAQLKRLSLVKFGC